MSKTAFRWARLGLLVAAALAVGVQSYNFHTAAPSESLVPTPATATMLATNPRSIFRDPYEGTEYLSLPRALITPKRPPERTPIVARRLTEGRSLLDFPAWQPSGVTTAKLERAFAGTPMAGLGGAFVAAEKRHGINALVLASIGIWESAWGRSRFAQERNNLFGYGAYTHNPDAAIMFESKEAGVEAAAVLLAKHYLTPKGKYYRGGTIRAIGTVYAGDGMKWSIGVSQVLELLMRRTGT
jgi:hypothetical protein